MAFICLSAVATFADEVPAKPPAVDLSYVPADAFGIVVVQPKRLMAAPELQMFPLEVATAALQKEIGIDPANVEQVVVVVENLFQPQPPEPGVVVHFAQAYDRAKVFPKLLAGAVEVQAGGKTYLKSPLRNVPAFYLPDNKTMVVANEDLLKRMLAAQPSATSPLHQRAKNLDTTAQAVALFSVDAVREPLNQMLAKAPPLPPPLSDVPKLLGLTSAYEFRFTLQGGFRTEAVFHAKDAPSAPEIEKIAKDAIQFAEQALQAQMSQQFARSQDPVEQALAKYTQRMVKSTFESIKIQRNGADVSVSSDQNFGMVTAGTAVALLLPALQSVKSAARHAQSQSNLHNFIIAIKTYETAHNRLPARAIMSKDGKPLLSWRVQILPYIEEDVLYRKFHLDEPWDSENNKPLIAQMPKIYESLDQPLAEGKTRYVVPVGKGTIFEGTEGLKEKQITDGTSKTICLVEVGPDKAVTWSKPEEMDYDSKQPLAGFGEISPRGFLAAFADGGVRTISSSVDVEVLRALFTYNGGEAVGIDDLDQ